MVKEREKGVSDNMPQGVSTIPLRKKISEIIDNLPPFHYTRLASGEIDYYGASYNISRSLELDRVPYTRASWLHGKIDLPLTQPMPEIIVQDNSVVCCDIKNVPNLVWTKEQEKFLHRLGYPHAVATGAPFIYTKKPSTQRIPGSLLVMPEISFKESNANYTYSIENILPDNFDSLQKKFSLICACIGGFCVERNNWTSFYEHNGIPWITGAWLHDSYAHQRMRNIFSMFEYVATNSIGSHIAYAGYSGCKVSYYGKGHLKPKEQYLDVPLYKRFPRLIEMSQKAYSLPQIKKKYHFLFQEPDKAVEIKEWADNNLGLTNRRSHSEIAKLIGWNIQRNENDQWQYILGQNPGLNDRQYQ